MSFPNNANGLLTVYHDDATSNPSFLTQNEENAQQEDFTKFVYPDSTQTMAQQASYDAPTHNYPNTTSGFNSYASPSNGGFPSQSYASSPYNTSTPNQHFSQPTSPENGYAYQSINKGIAYGSAHPTHITNGSQSQDQAQADSIPPHQPFPPIPSPQAVEAQSEPALPSNFIYLCHRCHAFIQSIANLKPELVVLIEPWSPRCVNFVCAQATSNLGNASANIPDSTPAPASLMRRLATRATHVRHRLRSTSRSRPTARSRPTNRSRASSVTLLDSPRPSTSRAKPSHKQGRHYCRVPNCDRAEGGERPFSRKDNRDTHEREVHGVPKQKAPKPKRPRTGRENGGGGFGGLVAGMGSGMGLAMVL